MTNPITSFAFPITGGPSPAGNRTLPDRLQDIHNVKDFGAKGDGATDDWAAIMACFNWNTFFCTSLTTTNQTASLTGAIASVASFQGSISGSVLTASATNDPTFGTLTLGALAISSYNYVSSTGVITLTMASAVGFNATTPLVIQGLNINGLNQGGYTAASVTGGGLTVTINGPVGLAGTASGGGTLIVGGVLAVGQTVTFSVSGSPVTDTIASLGTGSGGAGTYNLSSSHGTVATETMSTNCILTASSVSSGTINVGDSLLNNSGTDASPNVIPQDVFVTTKISSQQSGSAGGSGVYIVNNAVNFISQSLMTANGTIVVSGSPGRKIADNDYVVDTNNASVGHPQTPTLPGISTYDGVSTITIGYVNGLILSGDSLQIKPTNKGIIFFPPGNYIVSQPIFYVLSNPDDVSVIFAGSGAASTITGNFADYVLKRTFGFGTYGGIENLNIVNLNASGGGIRQGGSFLCYTRDCTITANKGYSNSDDDNRNDIVNIGSISLEISLENLVVNAGSNVTGSVGLALAANGPVLGCHIIGYERGTITFAGEGGQVFVGTTWEKCINGIEPGVLPDGSTDGANPICIGCHFNNCGTAINPGNLSGARWGGILIEATNGQGPSGGNAQYGLQDGSPGSGELLGDCSFKGWVIKGQYDQYAMYLRGQQFPQNVTWYGSSFANSSGLGVIFFDDAGGGPGVWKSLARFVACNETFIYKVANALPWTTGDEINVSDCNTTTWGATAGGSGSTHAVLYSDDTNLTVMGI